MESYKVESCEFCAHFSCCDGYGVCFKYITHDSPEDAIIENNRVSYRADFEEYINETESYDVYLNY